MATWPPTLADLKTDLINQDPDDDRDDAKLDLDLSAAVAFVERVRGEDFNLTGESDSELPEATDDLVLGTLRMAGRWGNRRRSPDGLVSLGADLGSGRIPSFDPDIERLLGVGRYAPMRFA